MALYDVVFPNGPDPTGLQDVLAGAGFDARPNPGGWIDVAGVRATIEAGGVVFRAFFAPDSRPEPEAHELANRLNLELPTARALVLNGGLILDHMVRADAGVERDTLFIALRSFLGQVAQASGVPPLPTPSTADRPAVFAPASPATVIMPNELDVPSVVAALVAGGVAAQADVEPGFAIAEHQDVRFLIDLKAPSGLAFAAYFEPPAGGDRATRLAFANYMNGRYGLARTKFDPKGHLVVDHALVPGLGLTKGTLAGTARFFAIVALRVRQAAQGWVHTPLSPG